MTANVATFGGLFVALLVRLSQQCGVCVCVIVLSVSVLCCAVLRSDALMCAML